MPAFKQWALLLQAPWLRLLREAVAEREATAGSLRLKFMDVRRAPRHDPDALKAVLTEALERLSAARNGFGELVVDHLRLVVAADHVEKHYDLGASAWGSRFQGRERYDAHYLACHLIWAATAVRLARDAAHAKQSFDRARVRAACWEAQKRYLGQFADAEDWIEYMDPDNHASDRRDGAA